MADPVLVVQERRRLFRESITACLRRQLDGVEVADGVPDFAGLMELSERSPLGHAVIEAENVPWDVPELAAAIHRRHPEASLIGLTTSARPVPCSGVTLLARSAGPEEVAELVRPGAGQRPPFVLTATSSNGSDVLSEQQLRILALLGLGLTAADVAARLGLSERSVSKSKSAMFARLGAQSQAQAMATALAAGLIGPLQRNPQP